MAIQASDMVRLSRQLTRFYAAAFAPLMEAQGITMREIHVIVFLANNPQFDTASDIVRRRGLLKSHVSQGVDTLCKKEILCRVPDQVDRRCTHLHFTPQGLPIGKQAQQLQAQWWENTMGLFTPEEQAQSIALLEKWIVALNTLEAQP